MKGKEKPIISWVKNLGNKILMVIFTIFVVLIFAFLLSLFSTLIGSIKSATDFLRKKAEYIVPIVLGVTVFATLALCGISTIMVSFWAIFAIHFSLICSIHESKNGKIEEINFFASVFIAIAGIFGTIFFSTIFPFYMVIIYGVAIFLLSFCKVFVDDMTYYDCNYGGGYYD